MSRTPAGNYDDGASRVTAIIPARGGSEGIKLKNLEMVAGQTLLARAIESAQQANAITDVVVSTDHPLIRAEAERMGAIVIDRPESLSGSEATSESALIYTLEQLDPEPAVTVMIQCTSPFISDVHLDQAVDRVLHGGEDCVFSAAENHNFLWSTGDDGVTAVGHDAAFRPRRQDREPQYRETGAFYVMRTRGLKSSGHRFFGRLGLQIVPEDTAIEIDTPADLATVRAMVRTIVDASGPAHGQLRHDDSEQQLRHNEAVEPVDVDALVTDFDGVHTDDHALVDGDGGEHVRVSRRDGMGVSLLRAAGIPQLILSTERHPVVGARAAKLRVDVLQDVSDKASALRQWMAVQRLDPARVAYVGNDVNDLAAMASVGWPIAVADAHPDVLAAARTVLAHNGGNGAVREICERILASLPTRIRQEPSAAGQSRPAGNSVIEKVSDQMSTMTTAEGTLTTTAGAGNGAATRDQAAPVSIGGKSIGPGQPVYVIGEIGINHNGDVEIAKQLIDVAAEAGAQAVKFQKRTPEISTPADMKNKMRSTPWGEMTYLEYKERVEFGRSDYEKLINHAAGLGLECFASPWDIPSVQFMEDLGAVTHKVASASVTDIEMLKVLAETGKPIILSTGMSTIEQIDAAVETLGTSRLIMLHSTSTYPLPPEEANLRTIETLRERYGVPVGYSGHERGLQISLAAVALGAVAVERHITLDRTMWGSDQASSLEPTGFEHLIRDIRILGEAMGDGEKRVMPGELAPLSRLRRVDGQNATAGRPA
ncbi:hypothetical protein GCM10027402_02960 [Arthrobacter monumenti]